MVNSSMISRAKFSFGEPLTLTPASRKASIAGSCAVATMSSRKSPVARCAEGLVLAQHLAHVAHLVLAGGEMAVPEQRHLLLERALGVEHAVRPPVRDAARLEHARAQPVEELVDHRLERPVAGRLDLDAERRAGLFRELGGRRPARRKVRRDRDRGCRTARTRAGRRWRSPRSRPDARPPARASSPRAPRSPRACRRSPRARADARRDRSSSRRPRSARDRPATPPARGP